MSVKLKGDTWWDISIVGMAIAVVALLAFVLMPKEQRDPGVTRFRNEEAKLKREIDETRTNVADLAEQNRTFLWNAAAERVSATVHEQVTRSAKTGGLRLVSFRPQKVEDVGSVQAMPFLATVEGSFPAVKALEASLENSNNRLAVTSLQVTSSNNAADLVTANIGLVAFRDARNAQDNTNAQDK
ncbi:MAG TPA: GspMb/PilO family protein [Fimbriimonadaceae bacterium]|nr:GspMb/PilO family protein [Fimbriimonadaceae bacterium]